MQQIKQIKKGLSVLDLEHRLSRVCCCAKNLHAVITSAAQKRKDWPFSARHSCTIRGKLTLTDNKSTDTLTAAVNLASTSTSTKVDFVGGSQRCIGNYGHVVSPWKKKSNYLSSMNLLSADDQFGSTQQWRTSSTNSASSADNTSVSDLQQSADQQRTSETYNAAKLSGSYA